MKILQPSLNILNIKCNDRDKHSLISIAFPSKKIGWVK